MKKILSILILSFIAFSSTAFAEDPQFIIEEAFVPFEPVPGELEIEFIPLESIPFEPIEPFEPEDPYWDDPNISISLEAEILEQGRVELR